jgi:hypothetical protein
MKGKVAAMDMNIPDNIADLPDDELVKAIEDIQGQGKPINGLQLLPHDTLVQLAQFAFYSMGAECVLFTLMKQMGIIVTSHPDTAKKVLSPFEMKKLLRMLFVEERS